MVPESGKRNSQKVVPPMSVAADFGEAATRRFTRAHLVNHAVAPILPGDPMEVGIAMFEFNKLINCLAKYTHTYILYVYIYIAL